MGNAAINQNANVLGLTGGSWGSSAGIVRADPYSIGAPSAPAQAAFSFDPSTVNAASDPGMAFAEQQALGAVGQGAFATGKGLSGAATVAAQQRAGDVANQYFGQAYARQYGAASDAYARNNAYGQQTYADQYGAATDTYNRAYNQFTDFENRLGTAAGQGQTADQSAAGVQTGTSALAAANDQSTGNTLANLVLGKATAGNAANTQLLSSLQSTGTDAVKTYLGLS